MFLVVFYSKLLLYNDLGGYNAESLISRILGIYLLVKKR